MSDQLSRARRLAKQRQKQRFHFERPVADSLRRRLRLEALESRRVLAPVSWDGGGDGINWSSPNNWSTNSLPTSADDVTINVVGTLTVIHASGSDTIRSLTSTENLNITGGSLTVTTGASTISGTLDVSNLASLNVNGSGASFTASSTVTLNGANLSASGGGTLDLSTATAYAEQAFSTTTIQASGTSSKVDLSGVTSLTGTNGTMNINALSGGTIELDGLPSATARDINFQVDGATSVLNLSALTSATDANLISSLTISNSGTLTAPVLATYNGGAIVVNNMSVNLTPLTNIDSSSLFANANGILTLPNVASYAEGPFAQTTFQASGANAKLDLTAMTSITGATGALIVNALSGGTIELDGLPSTTARDVNFQVDGATSVLNLSALTSATDANLISSLTISNSGTLTAPVFATYNGGTIVVNNMSVNLTPLTDINSSSLVANANGILTLPNVTSYAEAPFSQTTFQASGANAKLDLTAMTSITGATGALIINALSGGTIELDGLPSTTARDINFQVDGATSVLNLSALTSATDVNLVSSLTISNSGTLTAPVFATYNGGAIVVGGMSVNLSSLTNIDSSSLFANANGILTLPNVASYAEGPFAQTTFQASGANAKLDLTAMTSITGATGALIVNALSGGTIELDGLPSTTARDVNFQVDGATSVLNLSALTSATDVNLLSSLTLSNSGTLTAPVFATYNGGAIVVNNMSVNLTPLTNIDSSSLVANANGILTLPNVTSYAEAPGGQTTFQASGANAKLDLTAMTSITGATGAIVINALSGGTVELDGLPGTTARDVNFTANGVSSLIDLSALTSLSDVNNLDLISAVGSGTVTLGAGTVSVSGTFVSLATAGVINVGTLVIGAASSLTGSGIVNGNVTNNNTAGPGTSPGLITINGNYTQGSTAGLAIEILGLTVQTQYDQLEVNGTVALSGNLTLTGSYVASVGDSFTIVENDGVDPVSGTFNNSPEGDVYTFNGRPLRLSYTGGDGNDVVLTRVDNLDVNRRLFYNQSAFDGNNSAINTLDDGAIATDKSAYLPGAGLAVFANVSSYSRGINGVMIDISGTGAHTAINANDFVFKVGANNSPSTWAAGPLPTAISVRTAAGYRGADRIEITWANNAIQNQWLEIQVLPTANTGLGTADIFFFGNRIGDTGSPTATSFTTTVSDASTIIAGGLGAAGGITNVRDIDKSNTITVAGDRAAALANIGALNRLNVGTAGPFGPEGDAGIASALAATAGPATASSAPLPRGVARRLSIAPAGAASVAAALSVADDEGPAAVPDAADDGDDLALVEIDDELLTTLAAGL
ncbi:MAG: beta strand repeat-containing protein [Pirellulales bacterium]